MFCDALCEVEKLSIVLTSMTGMHTAQAV